MERIGEFECNLVASFGVDHFGHNQWIVSFTGDANTSMGSRTGTITVANQTFTVTQAEAPQPVRRASRRGAL